MTPEEERRAKNLIIEAIRRENGGKESRYEVVNREIEMTKGTWIVLGCIVLFIAGLFLLRHIVLG
jgi:hypothetical protein